MSKEKKSLYIKRIVISLITLIVLGFFVYFFLVPFMTPVKVRGIFVPYNYILNGSHVEIYEYTGNEEEVIIPERIFCRRVMVLQHDNEEHMACFKRNSTIKRVVIPDCVTCIGNNSFDQCVNLEEIMLPKGLQIIGDCAFRGCSSLEKIILAEGMERIGAGAFKGCELLTQVVIPDSVTLIGDEAFAGCVNLEIVMIPDTVERIGGQSFADTPWYEAQTGEFVEAGDRVLIKYSGSDRVIEVPDGITYIGDSVFNKVNRVKQLIIPESVEEIGAFAIYKENIKEIVLMNNDIILDEWAIVGGTDNTITIVARDGSAGQKYVEKYGKYNNLIWKELED